MADVVDWDLAVATGSRLAPRGPDASRDDVEAVVRQLKRASERAVMPVYDVTGLAAPFEVHRTVVVGRPEWVRANVRQLQTATEPIADLLGNPPAAVRAVGSRITAVQMGAVLAWMSSKVLGQFEAFGPDGRLMLVAPNIAHVERALGVEPTDFRLWVCLHEETHRVQFGAVPWLADYFTAEVHAYMTSTETDGLATLRRLMSASRAERQGVIDMFQTPEQREILDRLTALMSLLEGHADVVMDAVGPLVVPTVDDIRAKFDVRRQQHGAIDGFLRRALGLDAKLRQYVEGAAFVRAVVDRVGMPGFNAVWTSPETLPQPREIEDPAAWVRRVHG